MICPSCGHENPADSNFCFECGQPFEVRCPKCGAELPPAAKFCNRCGQRSVEPRTEVPSPEPALSSPSSFVSGRYTIQRLLGEGAKKRVYLGRDEQLDRDTAFALINPTEELQRSNTSDETMRPWVAALLKAGLPE